jgi:hypothetical protein
VTGAIVGTVVLTQQPNGASVVLDPL